MSKTISTKTSKELKVLIESDQELSRFIVQKGGLQAVVISQLRKDVEFMKEFKANVEKRHSVTGKS